MKPQNRTCRHRRASCCRCRETLPRRTTSAKIRPSLLAVLGVVAESHVWPSPWLPICRLADARLAFQPAIGPNPWTTLFLPISAMEPDGLLERPSPKSRRCIYRSGPRSAAESQNAQTKHSAPDASDAVTRQQPAGTPFGRRILEAESTDIEQCPIAWQPLQTTANQAWL